ncbi:MAG: amyA [Sphingomonas bacterium]|uniref:alpha-amylase family glycosyl hydrolase n=1 Tax=Sphingomonas bacterium TaxID=1895847 RepID=UPI00262373C0|nr:alpha-amylase family glycosyl hydrolase [Sphingomonas bacterium]MDB5705937.1 amyA [Sphingomonas bacterium]
MRHWILALLALIIAQPATAQKIPARYTPQAYVTIQHPAWSRKAILYQLNTRQFTKEGTFKAAEAQLPRLKALGVDIIWMMPVQPIGAKNRKGSLGSPYAVRDYYGVNPEFGALADLKSFIATAHRLGLHVILDWVANHTAWDNALVTQHPDWYERDWKGSFRPTPWYDWSDIIDLDYAKPALRQYMTAAMKHWVRDVGFDGFRCDVAGMVPVDFWNNARAELDAIKPVFMLAEWEWPDLHARAFDASYAWSWENAMHDIAMGKADTGALFNYYSWADGAWPRAAMRMLFTSNHDKNSWEGTDVERFGPALPNAIALSFVSDGIPLIYNGQEAGNTKRLEFFERDPIVWKQSPNGDLFKRLIAFRKSHAALDNAPWGGAMVRVVNTKPEAVFSFVREKGGDKVLALFNMTGTAQKIGFVDGPFVGSYRDFANGEAVTLATDSTMLLPPWSFRLLAR